MKAWIVSDIGAPQEVIAPGEREQPVPGPGEALLKVGAAGLGLPDVLMCRGKYAMSPPLPFVPGQEVAGEVVAVGENCSYAVGERVMGVTAFYHGHGSFAEYCIAPDFSLYPIPHGMDDNRAAGFTIPYHTAWVGLVERGALAEGEVLLVHGAAGGSGAAAIHLGKALGATVIATASSADKLAYAAAQGADHCINYADADFVAAVNEITAGRGADVVYDPVGGATYERSLECIASGGRLLAIGYASGRWGVADGRTLVARNASAIGVYVGAYGHEQMQGCHAALVELCAAGRLDPAPETVIGFDELGEYLERLAGRRALGKVVMAL
ncbi:MAG: NADPH:quinone oxidoreductase family protein [Halioglobus sp.]|nr:NADPH:quinone oxidoreductase family protein [Halioglobus sp.]